MKITISAFIFLTLLAGCNQEEREIIDPQSNTQTPSYDNQVNHALSEAQETSPNDSENSYGLDALEVTTPNQAPAQQALQLESQTSSKPDLPTFKVSNLPANDTLNVRIKAGTNNKIITALPEGTSVVLTGETKTTRNGQLWRKIKTEDNISGWVNDHYLDTPK